jgi:hypothetical protein
MVASSIPDEVTGFFNRPNPSGHTMALGSTHHLTEISTRNLPGGKRRPGRKADNLTVICEPIVYKMWEPRRLTILDPAPSSRVQTEEGAKEIIWAQQTASNGGGEITYFKKNCDMHTHI